MLDISSDFDPLISHDNINQESETDVQILIESQTALLREQNEALTKENASLHVQFEEAMRITRQVEEVHKVNRELKTQIREYQSQIDNMNQRMDISSRTIEELNQKLETEKMNSHSSHENDQAIVQKEIQKIKAQTQAQIDSLLEQVDQLNKSKEKCDMDSKLINGKISRCIDNAQHFFQATFGTFDDLITFLSQTPIIQPTPAPAQPQQQPPPIQPSLFQNQDMVNNQMQKLVKKLKKEKIKIKKLKNNNEDLEAAIAKLKRDQTDNDKKHQQEVDSLKKKVEQREEDMRSLVSEQKHQISSMKSKIESLKAENARRKQAESESYAQQLHSQQSMQQQPLYQQQNYGDSMLKNNKDPDLDQTYQTMSQKNTEISRQLRSAIAQRDELSAKVRDLENQKQENLLAIEKAKNELNAFEIVHKETVAELESVRNALHEREVGADKKEKTKLKREITSLKSQINNLQSSLESQKKQSYELSLNNEQSTHTISQLNQKIEESRKIIEEDQKTIESLRDDLLNAQSALEDKPKITPEDIMPPSVWRYPEFGSELCDQISKISINNAFQPATKLQSVYRAIHQYYNKIINQRNATLEQAYSESSSVKHNVNQFLINLTIALGIEPITFDDFFARNGSSVITATINKLRTCCDDFKRKNEQLTTALGHFYSSMNLPPESDVNLIIDQINNIREQIGMQQTVIQKKNKKCREVSSAFKCLKRKYECEVDELSRHIEQLNDSVEQLTKSNNELTSANQHYKRELQSLKVEYRDYKEKKEDTETTLIERHEDDARSWSQEKAQLLAQLHESSRIYDQKNTSFSGAIAENQTLIERLKQTIHNQKITISEKEDQIAKLKESNEEALRDITNKTEKEKKQLVQTYEKAVAEITEQSNAHRVDVEKLAKSMAESDKRFKQAKIAMAQFKRENAKVVNELQALKEQCERDKKLAESSLKTAVLNAENNFNSRLDEQKTTFENDKRRLYAYVADSFKQFFNPHENIDERTFKSTINRAKDELSRLVATDTAVRRLVCASAHQKTDDAVAQVLMNGT